MRILGVGIVTLDIVNTVDGYPEEDDEVRAISQRTSRGGNVTNTLVTLSQLGHQCTWAGSIAEDAASTSVRQDLARCGVAMEAVQSVASASLPTSYITLNKQNGSRTIVHYRNLEEYDYEAFKSIEIDAYDWIHFEGRNIPELTRMMSDLKNRGFEDFSLEVEKPRKGIEKLFQLPGLIMFSRNYVKETQQGSVRHFFENLRQQGVTAPVFCAWGKAGGWAMDEHGQIAQRPAWQPVNVIDTLGAGDVFNAAVIDGWLKRQPVEDVLTSACKLAGVKCGISGFEGIAEALYQ